MLRSTCNLLHGVLQRGQLNAERVGWAWAVGDKNGVVTQFGAELDQSAGVEKRGGRHMHGFAWVSGSMGVPPHGFEGKRNFANSAEVGVNADGEKGGGTTALKVRHL